MIKTQIFACFLILFISSSKAQSLVFFEPDTYASDMTQLSDGNLAVLISQKLYKVDPELNVLWASPDLATFWYTPATYIYELADHSLIVFNFSQMHHLSAEGELLSSIDIADYGYKQGWQTEDGFQIMKFTEPYFLYPAAWTHTKLSNEGEFEWSYSFESEQPIWAGGGVEYYYKDGNAYFLRCTNIFATDTLYFLKVDTSGNKLLSINTGYDETITEMSRVNDVTLISGITEDNKHFLYKLNDEGLFEWKAYSSVGANIYCADTAISPIETISHQYVMPIQDYNSADSTIYYRLQYFSLSGDSLYTGPKFLATNWYDSHYDISDFLQMSPETFAYMGNYVNYAGYYAPFIMITDTIGNLISLTVRGQVYYDENENNMFDPGEVDFKNVFIEASPIPFYAITNAEGKYTMNLFTEGEYTNHVVLPLYWDIVEPSAYAMELNGATTGDTLIEYDYQLSYSSPVKDISISLFDAGITIIDTSYAFITINNFGNQTVSGEFTLQHPSFVTLISSDPPFDAYSDTTITWNYSDFDPYESNSYRLLFISPADTALIGMPYQFIAETIIPGDINPADNFIADSGIVYSPWDPNHITANPEGIGPTGSTDPETEWITYTIEFQNTGNAPAINVFIADTIDADFEFTSLQMLSSDHNYWMEVKSPDIIIWHFDNINLPDSTSSRLRSTGFLQYRIKINEGSGIGTQLTNTAGIYFDQNPAVITNTTLNTLEEQPETAIDEELINNIYSIYPNPWQGETLHIYPENSVQPNYRFILVSIDGSLVETGVIHSNSIKLNNKISAGEYILKITGDDHVYQFKLIHL